MSDQQHKDDFAKLFRADDGGQVLVCKESDKEGRPEIFIISVFDGRMAKIKIGYENTNEGLANFESVFSGISQDLVNKVRYLAVNYSEMENNQ